MPIWLAFLIVTLIWGSTPLAIQWSLAGMSYQFAVTARMGIGVVIFLLMIPWLKRRPASLEQVVKVSLVSGLSMFLSMFCVYWGARFVPSGWMSVLFGFGPVVTGIMAAIWLQEPFTKEKILGSLLGLAGLMVFFSQGESLGEHALMGVGVLMLGVIIYAAGNIGIKWYGQGVSPLWVTAGTIWVAFPLFLAAWWLSGTSWPSSWTFKSGMAIVYLGLVGTGIGFVCFYYLLSRVTAAKAVLVTLTAPAVALWLGVVFNQEPLHGGLVLGTLLVLGGLSLFQWGGWLLQGRGRVRL